MLMPRPTSRLRIAALAALIAVALPALAQDSIPQDKPEPDLALLLEAGRQTRATPLIPGLDYRLVAVPAFGLKVHAFAFDTKQFHLRTAAQDNDTGNRVADFLVNPEDVFAIDGGFFERDDDGRLAASGLLVVDGEEVAPQHERAGSGVLHASADGVSISYRAEAPPAEAVDSAVQVGPVLVDPGGKVGIYSSQGDRRRRSAICLRPGELIAIVVDGDGLSLFQLAHVLAIPVDQGGVGCDVAINLDGGPSTQAVYRGGGRTIAIDGEATVHNGLVVSTSGR